MKKSDTGHLGDTFKMEAFIFIIFCAILVCMLVGAIKMHGFDKRQNEVSRRLVEFIAQNYDELASGSTLDYRGTSINIHSVLTRYRYCHSSIIITSSNVSGIYLALAADIDEEAINAKRTCQFITATLGWWGFPWGIINSIRYLYLNGVKNGTNDDTVGELMKRMADTAYANKNA